jgi:hypothetical protein
MHKKRGRPCKKNIENINNNDNNEIILHLPANICSDENDDYNSSGNNIFTMKYSDNENADINTFSDNKKIQKLKDEIKVKDLLMEKIKNNNKTYDPNIINLFLYENKSKFIYDNNKKYSATNFACWWCTYNFSSMPCFIPDKYYESIYYVFGYFCSFNCALSYNINMNDYKINHRQSLIYLLCHEIFNNDNIYIKLAPPKEILIKYGGDVNIEEYRNALLHINKEYNFIFPPMKSIITQIEEITY